MTAPVPGARVREIRAARERQRIGAEKLRILFELSELDATTRALKARMVARLERDLAAVAKMNLHRERLVREAAALAASAAPLSGEGVAGV